jgi:hypothetical protein
VRKPAERRSCAATLRRERRHATAVSLEGGGVGGAGEGSRGRWKVLEGSAEGAIDGGGDMGKDGAR